MELKEIQSLIKFVSEASVDEVSIERKDFKLSIRKNPPQIIQAPMAPQTVQATIPAAPAVSASVEVSAPKAEAPKTEAAAAPAASDKVIAIKSPMIGTFYRSPSPDKPVFVNVGDQISKGQVVCIVEAMKLFNEIESEIEGKVVKVLVDNAQPVEYDQPLYLVEVK